MKKIINVIFFLLLFSFSSEGQLVGHKTVCGKAKFKDNAITLQIFNDSDEDAYVLDSYFMQGLSNSK